ncbi:hypothetical protein DBV05_g4420 [Lasiodiplodia theobromae]|uniref:Uncharacterized protein n=1 Tax=Lasiodiplodia theobromae TaxID=45133 RepID=A0A5N5DGD6_9PEZI|nr:hypothetical protein DBV05_g4420 [Lasiodiplodia theobromae]
MRVSVFITAALGVVLAGVAIASAANHPIIERVDATLAQANGTSTQVNGTSTHANGTSTWASDGDHALSHSPIMRHTHSHSPSPILRHTHSHSPSPILRHTHSHSPILRLTHSRSPIFDPGVRPSTSEYNPTPKPVFSVGPYTSARPILMGGPYIPPNVSSHGTVTSLSSASAVDTPGVLPTIMAAGDDESAPAITPAPTKTVAGRAAAADDDEPSYAFPSYGDYPPDVFSDDDDFATGPPPFGALPTDALIKRYAEQHRGDMHPRSVNNGCYSPCYKFVRKYCRFLCHRVSVRGEATAAPAAGIEARRNRNRYSKTSSTTDRYTDHYTEDGTSTYAFPTTSAAPTTCNGCLDVSYPLCMEICNRE